MEWAYDALARRSPWKSTNPNNLRVPYSEKRRVISDPGSGTPQNGAKNSFNKTPRTPLQVITNNLGVSPASKSDISLKNHSLNDEIPKKETIGGSSQFSSIFADGDSLKNLTYKVDHVFHTPLKSTLADRKPYNTPKIQVYDPSAVSTESEVQRSSDQLPEPELMLPEFWTDDDEGFIEFDYLKKSADVWNTVKPPAEFQKLSSISVSDEDDLLYLESSMHISTPPYVLEQVAVPVPWDDL